MGGSHSIDRILTKPPRALSLRVLFLTPLIFIFFFCLSFRYLLMYLFSNLASLSPAFISSLPSASHVSVQRCFLVPTAASGSYQQLHMTQIQIYSDIVQYKTGFFLKQVWGDWPTARQDNFWINYCSFSWRNLIDRVFFSTNQNTHLVTHHVSRRASRKLSFCSDMFTKFTRETVG